jgi:hypothetical protein
MKAAEALAVRFNEKCVAVSQPRPARPSQSACSPAKAAAYRAAKRRDTAEQGHAEHLLLQPYCRWILFAVFGGSGWIAFLLSCCQLPGRTVAALLFALMLSPTPGAILALASIPARELTTEKSLKSSDFTPSFKEGPISRLPAVPTSAKASGSSQSSNASFTQPGVRIFRQDSRDIQTNWLRPENKTTLSEESGSSGLKVAGWSSICITRGMTMDYRTLIARLH